MSKNNYSLLSQTRNIKENGYIIIEDTLFEVRRKIIMDEWEVEGETWEEKVANAREVAELSPNIKILCDDIGYYCVEMILDEGELVSVHQIKLTEDEKSFVEYCRDHF